MIWMRAKNLTKPWNRDILLSYWETHVGLLSHFSTLTERVNSEPQSRSKLVKTLAIERELLYRMTLTFNPLSPAKMLFGFQVSAVQCSLLKRGRGKCLVQLNGGRNWRVNASDVDFLAQQFWFARDCLKCLTCHPSVINGVRLINLNSANGPL